MRHIHLFILFLLSLLHVGATAAEDYYFRHYTNRQGLSHNTVFCSLQDSKGFMWFGTDDGLNRFDGYAFTVYKEQTGRLPNNQITHLFEDSQGRIWICTNEGTCYYDYSDNAFHPLELPNNRQPPGQIFTILEDRSQRLWFVSNSLIIRYNRQTEEGVTYEASSYFYPNDATLSEEGFPLFCDNHTLYRYNEESGRFNSYPLLSEKERSGMAVWRITELPHVGVFVGTDNGGLKLFRYDNQQCETIIPDIHVRAITRYTNTSYWIASESGVYIYNVIDKSTVRLTKSLTNDYSLADNATYSITRDREGGVWIGSFFGGISYLPRQYTPFKHYIAGKTHPGMLGNAVRELCRDNYGFLWLGTEDNGINRYNPATEEMVNYSLNHPTNKLSATNIHGLFADGDTLWIGTFYKGIDLMDIPSGKVIEHFSHSENRLPNDFVLCFCKTSAGELLAGTSYGVVRYRREENDFVTWQAIPSLVRHILEDRKGRIWLSTFNGIYRYTPQRDEMRNYTAGGEVKGLGSNNTTSVFEDSHGDIWATTINGFAKYDSKADEFRYQELKEEIPSKMIYRMTEDEDGFFWLTTANGLVRFNGETNETRLYTQRDGLPETQFNFSSSYKAADGTIYMGTINGMISFRPRLFRNDNFNPPLYITRIHIPSDNNSQYAQQGILPDDFVLKLPHQKATFTLTFAALGYTSPEAVQYAYRLDGADGDWIDMGTNREVTFANLAPGSYRFRVKSTNSSQLWQENERVVLIQIQPPFLRTTPAYITYLLLIALGIFLFYRYKKNRLELRHKRAQELFETEKEKELYQAKIQFFTFITHEIRTPLTLIKAPLEKLMRIKGENPKERRLLHTIETNTQRLLDLSNQLLDFRKTESRGFKLNFIKTDILVWMESIIQPFLPLFEKEGKRFSYEYKEDSLVAFVDRDALNKIITNLLTNALKYSEKETTLYIRCHDGAEEGFQVIVTNDGALIPEEEKEAIFEPFYRIKETENVQGSGIGLSLSRSLVEFHRGTLTYQQTENQRNCFLLTLPLRQEGYSFEEAQSELIQQEAAVVTENKNDDRAVILIVEDQNDMRQFIVDELAESYQLMEAENGSIALQLLENKTVDLIISDIMMPVMDGFTLCNRLKNEISFSHIPLILLTAQHNQQSRLEGLNQGADAYMEKPFSLELLTAQIENLLRSRALLSQSYREKPQASVETLAQSPVDNLFITKLNSYLEEQLNNDTLSVESVATAMGMSASSFYRKVKGLSGITPVDFIRLFRLKKAVEYMQAGEMRINEIAYKTGFSSPAYFSTSFQKQYGKTPSEFMKGLMQ